MMSDADKFKERVHHQLNTFVRREPKGARVSQESIARARTRRSIEDLQEQLRLKRELEL